jgi:TonB family protein
MTLFDHLWQSTLCGGIAAWLALLLRHAPARWRHGVWLAASIKFLLPLALLTALGTSIGHWARAVTPRAVPDAMRWLGESRLLSTLVATRTSLADMAPWTEHAVPGLVIVWLAGAIAIVVWRGWQRIALARLIWQSSPLPSGREVEALQRVVCGRRRIDVRQAGAGLEPALAGIRRPTLLWPEGLSARLTDAEMDAILSHEVRHVERRDNLLASIHMVVEAIFWFHPLVWYIGARLAHERERACDEEVVQMGIDTRSYAEGIVKVCGFCLRAPAAAMGVGRSHLARRVERIMAAPVAVPPGRAARALLTVAGLTLVGGPVAAGALHLQERERQEESQPARPGNGITVPKVVYEVNPQYTRAALEEGIQGVVMLAVVVLESGLVGEVTVTQSLDQVYGLDEAAVEAVKQWRFEPATKDGKTVRVLVDIEMRFTLK